MWATPANMALRTSDFVKSMMINGLEVKYLVFCVNFKISRKAMFR